MKCPKCGTVLPEGAKFCHICGKPQTPQSRTSRRRGNGEGSVYKRPNGSWTASVVLGYKLDDDGKARPVRRTKSGFKTKKEALAAIPTLRQERHRTCPTIDDLWNQFQMGAYKKLSGSRQEKYRIAWPRIAEIRFVRIDQLTTADLQALVDQVQTFYPARDIRDLLSTLYQLAMPDQFVSTNLADFLVLPDKNEKTQDAFTAAEIQSLWRHYASSDANWWTGYILLMCYTGMMPGELLSATKAMVDLDARTITGAGKKTRTREITPIVLADIIVPVLEDLMNRTEGEKLIRINKDRFYTVYYQTIEAAGCRRLPPYTCRHTAATALAEANIPPSVIQKVMRHSSFQTTTRYIHIDTDPMQQAVNQLPPAPPLPKP